MSSRTTRRCRSSRIATAVVATTLACDGLPEPPRNLVVGPSETTKSAVERDVRAEVTRRLATLDVPAGSVQTDLLLWEVRKLANREATSDLVVVWMRYTRSDTDEWALGQLFRHRSGSVLDWQWYVVADAGWLELRTFQQAPTGDDLTAFLRYWDFEAEGRNGELIAAEINTSGMARLEDAPDLAYPDGTPTPDESGD